MPFITELISKVTNFRIKVGDKLNILKKEIGQLNSLTTNDKSSLVLAVNEVNRKAVVNDGKLSMTTSNGLEGSGNFTANQIGNTSIDFKIDSQTMTKINNGQTAYDRGDYSNLVPYTGANKHVDLGTNNITSNGITLGTVQGLFKGFTNNENKPYSFLTNEGGASKILTGGILASDTYNDYVNIPENGIYSKGTIRTADNGDSVKWNKSYESSKYRKVITLKGLGKNSYTSINLAPLNSGSCRVVITLISQYNNSPASGGNLVKEISFHDNGSSGFHTSYMRSLSANGNTAQDYLIKNLYVKDGYVRTDIIGIEGGDGNDITVYIEYYPINNNVINHEPTFTPILPHDASGEVKDIETAMTNGSNTIGGIWNIDMAYSEIFRKAGLTGQIYNATTSGTLFLGNPTVPLITIETTNAIDFGLYSPSGGRRQIWSGHNFDPDSKANTDGGNIINLPQWQNKLQIGDTSTLTTSDKTSLVGAVNEVNNIQIGGRNLLLQTTISEINLVGGVDIYAEKAYKISNLEKNTEYIFSVIAKGDEMTLISFIPNVIVDYKSLTTEFKLYTWKFSTSNEHAILDFLIRAQAGKNITITKAKLEKGNKATDWTPAPEDQVSDWAETNSDSLSFIKGKEIVNNEFNNVYNQISLRANNRLSNLASDLTVDEKRVIQDKTGAVSKTGDNVTPNSKWDNYSKGIYGQLDTDFWRIQGNLVSPNNVELELATADDATESIVVRQYYGEFTSKSREAYLLDANGNTSFPGTVTAQSFRMNGTTTTPAGVVSTESSIWQLGGDYGYGISMNAIGGLDIMANQPSQPIRLWSGQANANPYKSMEINGSSISVYGTIFTSSYGDSSQWKQAYNWGDHKSVDTHQYLGATYVGGGLRKPSDFGAGRLKLEMVNGNILGAPTYWNDVLWLSSYTGDDVKSSNALVFSKNEDEIGFLRQNFDSETWGTYHKIWHSGNFNPSSYLPLTGGELSNGNYNSEVLTAKGNIVVRGVESAYNLAFASKTTPFDIVSGHEYNWYNTYWKIGNRRGGTSDSIGFSFFLNGDEKLRIRPDGMVVGAKGYITEGFDLKVGKEAGNYIQFSEEETNHYGYNAFNGDTVCTSTFVSEGLQINQSAHIGSNLTVKGDTTLAQLAASSISTIGTVDIQGSLFANGASSFNSTVTALAFYESSLRKYKTNIKPYKESALEVLKNIDIVTFDRTDSGIKNKIGVIADDSPSEILNEELNAVDLYKTVFVLAKAVQELQEEIKQLKQQVEAE